MRLRRIFVLAFGIFTISTASALTIDFELPVKVIFAKTENELDYRYCDTKFLDFPIPIVGPIRAQYIFNPLPESGWSFGLGLSSYVYPFQTVAVSGSAFYSLAVFKNGGSVIIKNTLDFGLFSLTSSYFDVAKGRTVVKPYFSPAMEYSLSFDWRPSGTVPLYFGIGPGLGFAFAKETFFLYYGLNINFRFRLERKTYEN